jgi:hypothetical protein
MKGANGDAAIQPGRQVECAYPACQFTPDGVIPGL